MEKRSKIRKGENRDTLGGLFSFSHCIVGILCCAFAAYSFAPPLRVVENNLVDAKNRVVRLEGFAVYDANRWNDKSIVANWKNNWNASGIRLALHPAVWFINKSDQQREDYLKHVDKILSWFKEYKIYVVFDGYHESGSSGSVDHHWKYVSEVWPILAKRYKDADHIIWEIYNEPYEISWEKWVPKARELIDIIRSYKPVVTACIVPGVDWATELDFNKAKLDREEIMYSFHIYPHVYNHVWEKSNYKETYDKKMGYIYKNKIAPILVGEWHAIDDNEIKKFGPLLLSYCKEIGASQTQWGYFPGWGRNLVDNQNGKPEKKSAQGEWYSKYLNSVTSVQPSALPDISDKKSRFIVNPLSVSCFHTGPQIRLRIFDMQGRLIHSCLEKSDNSENYGIRLPLEKNSKGNYLIELKTGKSAQTQIAPIIGR